MIERKYLGDNHVKWTVTISGYGIVWVHEAGRPKSVALIGLRYITQVYRVGDSPFDNAKPGWCFERHPYIRLHR